MHPDIVLVEINDTTIRDLAPHLRPLAVAAPGDGVARRLPQPRPRESHRHGRRLSRGRSGTSRSGSETTVRTSRGRRPTRRSRTRSARRATSSCWPTPYTRHDQGGDEAEHAGAGGGLAPTSLGPAIEELPLVVPPFQVLTDAAAALGHNFLALDPDGPARRMPPFIRVGRPLHALARRRRRADGGGSPPGGGRARRERSCESASRRVPLLPTRVEDAEDPRRAHDQWSMLINYRAPALVDGTRPYRLVRGAPSDLRRKTSCSAARSRLVDPARFRRTRSSSSASRRSGLLDVFQTPFGKQTDAGHPAAREHGRQHPVRPVHASGGRAQPRPWQSLAGAVLVGLLTVAAAVHRGARPARCSRWPAGRVRARRRSSGGLWLPMAGPARRRWRSRCSAAPRIGTSSRTARSGKSRGLFGRYVSRDVYAQLLERPGAGAARRQPPRR